MSIEVLKREDISTHPKPIVTTCGGCKSELKFEIEDAWIDFYFLGDLRGYVRCPVCGYWANGGFGSEQNAYAVRNRSRLRNLTNLVRHSLGIHL